MKSTRLRLVLAALAIALAAVYSYVSRFQMNVDGVSYLDIGAAFVRGDWSRAVSSYWGPVYPWLLGVVVWLSRSSGLGQIAAAHFLNFLIFLLAIFVFDKFWCKVLSEVSGDNARPLRSAGLWMGYTTFILTFVPMVAFISPDLLLAAIVFGIGLFLWKFASEMQGRWLMMAGILFGAGYLVKAVMFPVGVVTLFVSGVMMLLQRRSVRPLLWSAVAFLLVCSPLLIGLSKRAGHFSTGDSGRLNYAWFVTDGPRGLDSKDLYPVGEAISSDPTIYKIETKPFVTYWPWFDPPALTTHVHAKVKLRNQAAVLVRSFLVYARILSNGYVFLFMGILILLYCNLPKFRRLQHANYVPWLTYLVSALGAYALVLVEMRYVSAFGCVLLGGLLGFGATGIDEKQTRFASRVIVVATVLFVALSLPPFVSELRAVRASRVTFTEQAQLARTLQANGVASGERIALLASGSPSYWVKLSNTSMAALIPASEVSAFCRSGKGPSEEVLQKVRSTGARWLVTAASTKDCALDGWQTVPETSFRFKKLE